MKIQHSKKKLCYIYNEVLGGGKNVFTFYKLKWKTKLSTKHQTLENFVHASSSLHEIINKMICTLINIGTKILNKISAQWCKKVWYIISTRKRWFKEGKLLSIFKNESIPHIKKMKTNFVIYSVIAKREFDRIQSHPWQKLAEDSELYGISSIW